MKRRVGVQRVELRLVLHRAELRHVERPVRLQFHAQHVVDAHSGDHGAKQVGALRQHGAHEQSAIAPALDGQLLRVRVIGLDEILRARDEVIEDILLLRQVAHLVPLLAELPAPAQVRDRIHAARVEPHAATQREGRRKADAVAAVAVENRRIVSVELRVLALDDVDGNLRPVLAHREFPHRLHVVEFHRRRARQRRAIDAIPAAVRVVSVPRPRRRVAHRAEGQFIAASHEHLLHCDQPAQRHLAHKLPLAVEVTNLRRTARQVLHIHPMLRRLEAVDHHVALGHELLRVRQAHLRAVQRQTQDPPVRCALTRQQVERVVLAEHRRLDAVLELRQLLPRAIRAAQPVIEISAVPIRHHRQHQLPVFA